MEIEQDIWTAGGWRAGLAGRLGDSAQLVLTFGDGALLKEGARLEEIRRAYPAAQIVGCSTAGEICDTRVFESSLTVTAVRFQSSTVKGADIGIDEVDSSREAGARLAQALDKAGLVHVFVVSDGLRINGSELVRGLTENLPPTVTVTGGLSGDGARFRETFVCYQGAAQQGRVAALGLYGDRLKVGYGCLGGWDPFGPERKITRSRGNVLYELDRNSALELYKTYLGEHAAGLPSTGLLFPLSVRCDQGETGVVRTILAVDEAAQSMTFAGDLPEGAYARLMKANFDRLIDGSMGAAQAARECGGGKPPELAILISCVGRKLVLSQRVEEELEGAREVLGEATALTGFYSYGEISPFGRDGRCELHNQTMTITTFSEE